MRAGTRTATFWLQIAYLLALFGVAFLYLTSPRHLGIPDSFGLIPVGVPWFGALGAVLISLTGVFQHAHDWDESYAFWHWSRPVVGAAIAVVAVLMLQAGILSVGGSPQPQPRSPSASISTTPPASPSAASSPGSPAAATTAPPTTPALQGAPQSQQTSQNPILFYVIAFVVAYREETFRELIKRAADVILTPATPPVAPSATAMAPQDGPAAGHTDVTVTGKGLAGVTKVTFGTTSAFFRVDSDTQVTTTSPPGSAGTRVPVVVSGKGGSSTAGQFTYT